MRVLSVALRFRVWAFGEDAEQDFEGFRNFGLAWTFDSWGEPVSQGVSLVCETLQFYP